MKHGETKPNRLQVWGHSLFNKLSGRSRKQRKRDASKKRRVALAAQGQTAIHFLVSHPDVRAELLDLISSLLDSKLDLEAFWRRYQSLYSDTPTGAVSDHDWLFFSEVNERLDLTDWKRPAEPELEDPESFRTWLRSAYEAFHSGTWRPST